MWVLAVEDVTLRSLALLGYELSSLGLLKLPPVAEDMTTNNTVRSYVLNNGLYVVNLLKTIYYVLSFSVNYSHKTRVK